MLNTSTILLNFYGRKINPEWQPNVDDSSSFSSEMEKLTAPTKKKSIDSGYGKALDGRERSGLEHSYLAYLYCVRSCNEINWILSVIQSYFELQN